jgi:cyclophilin family peptidyl-prolyl cis-trans isomerase
MRLRSLFLPAALGLLAATAAVAQDAPAHGLELSTAVINSRAVVVGDPIHLAVTLTNTGQAPISLPELLEDRHVISFDLKHGEGPSVVYERIHKGPATAQRFFWPASPLAPGESRELRVDLVALDAGPLEVTAHLARPVEYIHHIRNQAGEQVLIVTPGQSISAHGNWPAGGAAFTATINGRPCTVQGAGAGTVSLTVPQDAAILQTRPTDPGAETPPPLELKLSREGHRDMWAYINIYTEGSTGVPAPEVPLPQCPHVTAASTRVDVQPTSTGQTTVEARVITTYGPLQVRLFTEQALGTCMDFARLAQLGGEDNRGRARSRFFDGSTFHLVDRWESVIQGGCPLNTGTGGPGYTIRNEAPSQPGEAIDHRPGRIGMALHSAHRDSAGAQFYVCVAPGDTSDHNGRSTVFAEITRGMDVMNTIRDVELVSDPHTGLATSPRQRVAIVSVRIRPAAAPN